MRKGGTISVRNYLPNHQLPNWLTFGLAWDVTNGVNIDLDASVIVLDKELNELGIISYKKLQSADGSIRHSGEREETKPATMKRFRFRFRISTQMLVVLDS